MKEKIRQVLQRFLSRFQGLSKKYGQVGRQARSVGRLPPGLLVMVVVMVVRPAVLLPALLALLELVHPGLVDLVGLPLQVRLGLGILQQLVHDGLLPLLSGHPAREKVGVALDHAANL